MIGSKLGEATVNRRTRPRDPSPADTTGPASPSGSTGPPNVAVGRVSSRISNEPLTSPDR